MREAQECVELFLKGALRLVAVEPTRTHDVAVVLRQEAGRFPDWFRAAADRLATISSEMAGDRGPAFYGDERQSLGPRELFGESDAREAVRNVEFVAELCERPRGRVGLTSGRYPTEASSGRCWRPSGILHGGCALTRKTARRRVARRRAPCLG